MKKEIINLLKKYKWMMIIMLIFIVANAYLAIAPSNILGDIINCLENIEQNKIQIFKLLGKLFISCIGILLTRLVWKNLEFQYELKFIKELKEHMFTKLMKVKIEKLEEIKNGKIMTFFVGDVRIVGKNIIRYISSIVRIIMYFSTIIITMTKDSNLKLTFITILPILATILIIVLLRDRVSESFKSAQKSFTELSEFVQESTDSIRTMKAFVGEESQISEFQKKSKIVKENNLRVTRNQNLLDICISVGFGLAYAVNLLYGSKMVIAGEITPGDLVTFTGYLAILQMPVYWIPWLLTKFKKIRVSYERLNQLMELPEEEIDVEDTKNYGELIGNIEIKDLTYNYPGYIERVLENINLNVKKGESLGIIGVLGSGKTTLMNLLLKLYDVERGKIFIDGVDINDIPTKKIRDNICYITQDNFLFSASLKENINLFKEGYKDDEIEESTKKAMIYEEISKMEEGINTIIGEKGIDLSGGQKQRVVISRAFLNNSNIVIFDDTFSALDNRTEQHVLNNIKELTKDKTCIIISNRISDIKDCDQIIVLDQGVIVEKGIHNNLIEKKGKYYEFYENQAHKADFEVLA